MRMAAMSAMAILVAAGPVAAAPGDVTASFPSPGYYPSGLAWDGESLWVANERTGYDGPDFPNKDHLGKVAPDGTVLATFLTPYKYFHGLAWDGEWIWGDEMYDAVRKVDPTSGAVVSSFSSVGTAYGLTYDPRSQSLFQADRDTNAIHEFDRNGTQLGSLFPDEPAGGHDLAWDGCYLWQTNTSTDRVYRIHPLTGTVLDSIPAPAGAGEGLTFDGTDLWLSDTGTDRLYRIEPITSHPVGLEVETDSDGVPDRCDNCAAKANGDQADMDGDGIGDVCDDLENGGTDPTDPGDPEEDPSDPGDPAADPSVPGASSDEVGGCACSLAAGAQGTPRASLVLALALAIGAAVTRRRACRLGETAR